VADREVCISKRQRQIIMTWPDSVNYAGIGDVGEGAGIYILNVYQLAGEKRRKGVEAGRQRWGTVQKRGSAGSKGT